jgi:hypothetical protein
MSANLNYEVYANEIAKVCKSPPSLVLDILELSREKRILYHGVKKSRYVDSIMKIGLENRTPVDGGVTYFTTGIRLFAIYEKLPISTYDTSFFHHGHHDKGMCLVMTDEKLVSKCGFPDMWRNDSQIKLGNVLPPDYFSVINISSKDAIRDRSDRISLEQRMLRELYGHLKNYDPRKKLFL